MAYNRALDLMALALEATIANKPRTAAKMLAAAAKDASAASAIEAVVAANKAELASSKVTAAKMRRRSLSLLQRRVKRAGVEPEAELEGDDLRVEVESDFDDELLMEDDDLGIEDFAKTVKFETKSAKKAKAKDEAEEEDEDEDEDEDKDDDEGEDKDEEKAAQVARFRRALSNLSRRRS